MDNWYIVFQVLINNSLNCHSGTTKDVLITSTYVHMNCGSKFGKYAADLSTVCPRILLSGPAGMKETLYNYCL